MGLSGVVRTQAYADYHDLMAMTEEMVAQMVLQLRGSYRMEYHANGADAPPVQIDFTPPWRRISMARPMPLSGRRHQWAAPGLMSRSRVMTWGRSCHRLQHLATSLEPRLAHVREV